MNRETMKGLAKLTGIAAIGTGIAFASEKSGFTDSLLIHDWGERMICHEISEDHPFLYFGVRYPSPGSLGDYISNPARRIGASAGAGVLGLVNLGVLALGLSMGRSNNYRESEENQGS